MKGFAVSVNRQAKALKILSVLEDYRKESTSGLMVLNIGCGNGEIADYFSEIGNDVFCVDIEDQRLNKGYCEFRQVQDENLPFDDEFFDIVISNHIIEHVSNADLHLNEIKRVLKSDGVCYLATPNRIFPYEVHYKLFFLHWLPNSFFMMLLKLFGKYKEDLFLLSHFSLLRKIKKHFKATEYTHKIVAEPDKYFANDMIPSIIAGKNLKWLNWASPTLVFILKKNEK